MTTENQPFQSRARFDIPYREEAVESARREVRQERSLHGIAFLYWLHLRFPFLHALLLEFCSLAGRIAILRENKLHLGMSLGPTWEQDANQRLVKCTRTRVRMMCIRRLHAIHPRASLVDHFLLIQSLHPKLALSDWDREGKYQGNEARGDTK